MEKQYYRKLIQLWKPLKIFTYCSENCKKINSFIPIQYFYPINQYLHLVEFNERLFQNREKDKIVFIGKTVTNENWKSLSIPFGKSEEYNQGKFAKPKRTSHFTDD